MSRQLHLGFSGTETKIFRSSFNKIPSPDTVEYVRQELKTKTILIETDKGIHHQLNYNNEMNETLVALAVKTNQLNILYTDYIVDFDNVITENEKQDAEYTFKHCKRYHSGIAFIGCIPVHRENSNDNTPARYQQKEALERLSANLNK